MNGLISVCAAAVISAIFTLIIKKYNGELALVLGICACTAILLWTIAQFSQAFGHISELAKSGGVNQEYFSVVIKTVGICVLTEFAYNCCKDAGQNALASNTLLAGKIMAAAAVMPLFEKILEISLELIGI